MWIVEIIWTHRARLLHCPLVRNRGVSSLEIVDQTAGHEARGDSVSDIERLMLEKDGMWRSRVNTEASGNRKACATPDAART